MKVVMQALASNIMNANQYPLDEFLGDLKDSYARLNPNRENPYQGIAQKCAWLWPDQDRATRLKLFREWFDRPITTSYDLKRCEALAVIAALNEPHTRAEIESEIAKCRI